MAYWKAVSGLIDPIPMRNFKGVYNNDDGGFALPEGYAQDLRNLSSEYYPAISPRPGFSLLGSTLSGRITGLSQYQGSEIHAIAGGVWSKCDGSSWSTLSSGLSTTSDCSFTQFKGNLSAVNLIMANGTDTVRSYNGSSVSTLSGAPSGLNHIEQHDNRLYGSALDSTSGKRIIIKYSALSKADDWSTAKDAGEIRLETNNGEEIVGLRAGNQHLTVFKKSSIHELYGTGPSNYKLIEVANDVGAYSNKSIVNVAGVLYFISNKIYQYAGGSRPDWSFCKPVQNYLAGINPNYTANCVAGSNGKNPYFAIPYGDASDPNMILEWDTTYQVWYIWDGFTPTQFLRYKSDWYFGDTSGQVCKFGATTDNGTATNWKWVSPPYGSENLTRRNQWYNLYLFVNLPSGSELNVYLSKSVTGDSDWVKVKSVTAQTGAQNSRIIIPLNTVALSNFIRIMLQGTGPFQVWEVDRQMRKMPMK